jgi:WD40 repeat protein
VERACSAASRCASALKRDKGRKVKGARIIVWREYRRPWRSGSSSGLLRVRITVAKRRNSKRSCSWRATLNARCARCWKLSKQSSGGMLRRCERETHESAGCLSFSPSGTTMESASVSETSRVWSVRAQRLPSLEPHPRQLVRRREASTSSVVSSLSSRVAVLTAEP